MVRNFVVNVARTAAAVLAGVVMGTTPVVFAQEGDNMIDLSKLIFFRGAAYSVTYEEGVSTAATETATVRKIGYGQTTVVNITTTSSGVYSSDAMTSPYIRYPGVFVSRLPASADETEGGIQAPQLAYWSEGKGWVATPFVTAGSFAVVTRTPYGTTVVNSTEGNCVITAIVARC